MKKIFRELSVAVLLCFAGLSCKKENTPEAIVVKPELQRSTDYYANLRAYKKSDHEVFFGWFGSTGADGSADFAGILDQIPDSVDIVSLWGGVPALKTYNHQKLLSLQQEKGMKFVWVNFDNSSFLNSMSDTSDFETKYDQGDSLLNIGFSLIAKNINDTIQKYHLDGIDLDHEPSVCGCDWGLLRDDDKYSLFIKALSKYVGPLSGTEKLLIVDGEYNMSADAGACLSYIASQAYGSDSPDGLAYRAKRLPVGFPVNRFIVTENFESFWRTGGIDYDDPIRGIIPSLLGMAYWEPTEGHKAGAGAYHAEYDYGSTPDYTYVRQAIQIMNPAAK